MATSRPGLELVGRVYKYVALTRLIGLRHSLENSRYCAGEDEGGVVVVIGISHRIEERNHRKNHVHH